MATMSKINGYDLKDNVSGYRTAAQIQSMLPTVNNATLIFTYDNRTIPEDGILGTFTANSSTDTNIIIPAAPDAANFVKRTGQTNMTGNFKTTGTFESSVCKTDTFSVKNGTTSNYINFGIQIVNTW